MLPKNAMHFNSKKFVREDQDIRFSNDPEDPLFVEHYFDFVEKHFDLFSISTFKKDRLDLTFTCQCGCEGMHRKNWEVYVFKAWFNSWDGETESLTVDPTFFKHFFHGKIKKLRKKIWENVGLPETCYLLECKKCGAWYIWKI